MNEFAPQRENSERPVGLSIERLDDGRYEFRRASAAAVTDPHVSVSLADEIRPRREASETAVSAVGPLIFDNFDLVERGSVSHDPLTFTKVKVETGLIEDEERRLAVAQRVAEMIFEVADGQK